MGLRAIQAALMCVVTSGCVTRARYDELGQRLDRSEHALRSEQRAERLAYEEQLQVRQLRLANLESAYAQAQQAAEDYRVRSSALETSLLAAQGEQATLEQRMANTERELATVVKRRSELRESVEQMSAALEELRRSQVAAQRRVDQYRALLERLAGLVDAGKLQVQIVEGRMVLTLPMDILFASGRTELTPEGRQSLGEVAAVLATVPDRSFQVEGHTDNVPINTARFASNWELGSERALVVMRAMVAGGVSTTRISAATYADQRPLESNDSAEGRAINRRIEIVVVPDLSLLPGYEQLNRLGATSSKPAS